MEGARAWNSRGGRWREEVKPLRFPTERGACHDARVGAQSNLPNNCRFVKNRQKSLFAATCGTHNALLTPAAQWKQLAGRHRCLHPSVCPHHGSPFTQRLLHTPRLF